MALFGPRIMPKKRVQPYQANNLDTGFTGADSLGVGISPGGRNSKYATPTPFGNPVDQIMSLFKKKKAIK